MINAIPIKGSAQRNMLFFLKSSHPSNFNSFRRKKAPKAHTVNNRRTIKKLMGKKSDKKVTTVFENTSPKRIFSVKLEGIRRILVTETPEIIRKNNVTTLEKKRAIMKKNYFPEKKLYIKMHTIARKPSLQPIFFPSRYVLPW